MHRYIYPAKQIAGLFFQLVTVLAVMAAAGAFAAERVYLDISAQDVRKVIIAIPGFSDGEGAATDARGKEMAALLGRGLEFHGFVEVIDPAKYGGGRDADWQQMGVDYVILGKYETAGEGMMIEGRLLDVAEDRMLTGRRYRGTVSQQQDMVLRLCDALVEEFTGTPGISRSRLAYVSDESGSKEVYISDVLGLDRRRITRHNHLVVSPRFSPDGVYLAYSSYHSGNQNLYVTDLRQNQVTRAISRRKGMNLAPAWSPDGESMIVTLSKDGSPDLYLLDRRGNIKERLTSRAGINVSASWSPDGKSIVFVSDRSGMPQIYRMNLQNRRVERLTFENSENTEPTWSPDGEYIAYTGLKEGRYHIFVMDPDDPLSARQVTSGWGDFESPTWSPDGKQISFSRQRNTSQQICVIHRDGREMRVLFDLPGRQSYPRWAGPME